MKKTISTIGFIFLCLSIASQNKLSVIPSIHFNTMFASTEYPMGIGVMVDIDYNPTYPAKTANTILFSIALRPKYTYFKFNDNSNIEYDINGNINPYNPNPKLLYNFNLPQIGIVPKLYLPIDGNVYLFLENDISVGYLNGNIKYIESSREKKNVEKLILTYTPSVGITFDANSVNVLLSIGWNFIDFKNIIKENKPSNYNYPISAQTPGVVMRLGITIPIKR